MRRSILIASGIAVLVAGASLVVQRTATPKDSTSQGEAPAIPSPPAAVSSPTRPQPDRAGAEQAARTAVRMTGEIATAGFISRADLIGSIYSGNLWLEFHQPAPFIGGGIGLLAVDPFAQAGAYLFACDPLLDQSTSSPTCTQIQSNAATVTFSRVSEPATAGLVLLAIAGIAVVRRRRAAAAA